MSINKYWRLCIEFLKDLELDVNQYATKSI